MRGAKAEEAADRRSEAFGGRDHSTVIHSVDKVQRTMAADLVATLALQAERTNARGERQPATVAQAASDARLELPSLRLEPVKPT